MTEQELLKLANVVEPPVPVERIARLRGAEIRYVPFEGKVSGLLYRRGSNIIIGVNALDAKNRQRFTIAHEIGHLELHTTSELHIDRTFPVAQGIEYYAARNELSAQGINSEEMQANAFAARLLMPAQMLRRDLQGCLVDWDNDELLRNLAEHYKVSLQAMSIRLTTLRLIAPTPESSPDEDY